LVKVYLIRHGESEGNRNKIFQGCLDYELTREGIQQAYKLAERLKFCQIQRIYSSGLARAYTTAKIIAVHHNISVNKLREFNEIDFGILQGKTRPEIEKTYPEILKAFFQYPHEVYFPEGETLNEMKTRVLKGLKRIIKENKGYSVCIVAHGIVNKVIMCTVEGKPLSKIWDYPQDNTALNILMFFKGINSGRVIKLNDTQHLEKRDYRL